METLTGEKVSITGMIHVRALPGTPRWSLSVDEIARIAVEEALLLSKSGFDAVLLENMHDVPYLRRNIGPEIVASMARVANEVRKSVNCPIGIQILAGANREAIAVAHSCGAQFVRVEGFVFAHIADEGIMESDAGDLLRYRKLIGAQEIKIFTDIKKKHSSHAITGDLDLAETARAAEFFGADALIVTGKSTGFPPARNDLDKAGEGSSLPLIVGSGTTPETLTDCWGLAKGFIIGSYLKKGGKWDQPLDQSRIDRIMETVKRLRKENN
jgi:membrane complex biogenesis BtpA family protein